MIIFSCFLSVVGGLDQTCRDEQFDIKYSRSVQRIVSAVDQTDLCFFAVAGSVGRGLKRVNFLLMGLGGFFRWRILTVCAECCEKVKQCQKKPPALFMILLLILVLVHLVK